MKKIPLEIKNICTVYTLVDDEDYEKIKDFNWKLNYHNNCFSVYATHRHGEKGKDGRKSRVIYKLHRLIMNCPKDMIVDHINGDGLDNRKCNLRIANLSQNAANFIAKKRKQGKTSKYLGVSVIERKKSGPAYQVYFSFNNKTKNLKSFNNEIEAAEFYDLNVIKYRGEFGVLNFPEKLNYYNNLLKKDK